MLLFFQIAKSTYFYILKNINEEDSNKKEKKLILDIFNKIKQGMDIEE
ncbi:hypothetical protein [Metamycoplasma phocicerebrale]|nr:hypothetical protein [Metamycoplasma phocicerebrale]